MRKMYGIWFALLLVCLVPMVASAQNGATVQGGGSFMVQCPATTAFHPAPFAAGAAEPDYTGPQPLTSTLNGITFSPAANTDNQHAPYIGNGGQIINGPMEVPGGARISILGDPQGTGFAVHSRKAQ